MKNLGIIFHNVISNYCLNEPGFNLLGVLNGFAHLNRKFLRIFQEGLRADVSRTLSLHKIQDPKK